jgi:hypothetical protein
MIQRIQTVYLLSAAIISGVSIFVFHLWVSAGKSIFVVDLFQNSSYQIKSIPVLFFTSSVIALISIFMFKNRKLQFVFGRFIILINFILLGLLLYVSLKLPGETAVSEKGIGMFIPILVILLVVFANKAIKKDKDLVNSADRLR